MTLPGRGAEAGEAWTEASSCDVCEEVGLTEPSVHLEPPAALLRGPEQGAGPLGDLALPAVNDLAGFTRIITRSSRGGQHMLGDNPVAAYHLDLEETV